ALVTAPSATAGDGERLAGTDRFSTAARISATLPVGPAPHVFVANGMDFPDGVSGGAAAARDGSPLLLVRADRVPPATASELRRLQPETITVLGGEHAVSASVASSLSRITGASVTRWAGSDRYGTSAEISRKSTSPGV